MRSHLPRLQAAASPRLALGALVLSLTFAATLFLLGPYSALRASFGGDLPEESLALAASQLGPAILALDAPARRAYRLFQLLDAVNALLTAAALTFVITAALRRRLAARSLLWWLLALPALACLLDLAENAALLSLLSSPNAAALASLARAATLAKFGAASAATLTALISVAAAGWALLRARTSP